MHYLLFYDYNNTPFLYHQIFGISLNRGKKFRNYWTKGFESEEDKATDEWWREHFLIDGFNESCKNIVDSYLKVVDDYMHAIRFCTTAKGNLPHLSYIFRKTYPLGTELNTVSCSVTGSLLFIEVHRKSKA